MLATLHLSTHGHPANLCKDISKSQSPTAGHCWTLRLSQVAFKGKPKPGSACAQNIVLFWLASCRAYQGRAQLTAHCNYPMPCTLLHSSTVTYFLVILATTLRPVSTPTFCSQQLSQLLKRRLGLLELLQLPFVISMLLSHHKGVGPPCPVVT